MIAYVLPRVFVILLIVAANAFFAAAEFALVSVRETRIQQLIEANRIGARTVLKLHQQLTRVVNGVQLGITVTSLTLGWVGEPVLAHLFESWIGSIPYAGVYAHTAAVVVAFVLITNLHVILGELVPKSLALQRAERVALAVATPMDVFLTVTGPVTMLMSRVAGVVLRAFGTREIRHGSVHSPDELKLIVTAARTSGQLSSSQEDMLLNALELDNITARQVMVPRTKIFSLPADLNLDDALSRVVEDQHSRIPIYDPERGPEHIVGVLYAKDLMRWTRMRVSFSDTPPAAMRVARMKIGQIRKRSRCSNCLANSSNGNATWRWWSMNSVQQPASSRSRMCWSNWSVSWKMSSMWRRRRRRIWTRMRRCHSTDRSTSAIWNRSTI
jgi:CBS domain containing-hemolysin-like protein